MKKFWPEFFKRGCIAAWSGPVVLCIIWTCLKAAGVVNVLDVDTAVMGIISSVVIAFIAAGITAVYQMEQLPIGMAALIQMAVLYTDYLVIYLLNGWMKVEKIGIFSVCFFAGFAVIWVIIYITTRNSVKKLNVQFNNDCERNEK